MQLKHISHMTKQEIYDIARQFDGMTLCEECKHKNTNYCPAYDAPMQRTSLRIKFCNCGKSK